MPLPNFTTLLLVLYVDCGSLLLYLNIDVARSELKRPLPDLTRLILII